jgi:hypothetical protein
MRPVSTAGVSGLLVISMIALAAPVLAAGVQRARVPDVVIEIVAGIVVGPSVLGWVKIDQPVGLVALLGLAFLLFLAGLEVDLKVVTPSRLRAPLAGRGESPPDPGTIADAVLGPLYRRALWGTLPADPAYPSSLVDRLLGPTCHNDPNT